MSTNKTISTQGPQENLWPSTLSPVRFLPPWGKRIHDMSEFMGENTVDSHKTMPEGLGEQQKDNLFVGKQNSSPKLNIEQPRPLYHNIYSLPMADSDAKDPAWVAPSYSLPQDALLPAEIPPQDFYERLSLPVHSSSIISDADSSPFVDSLGLLTEDVDEKSNVRKKPRLEEPEPLALNATVSAPLSFSPYSFASTAPSLDFTFSAYPEVPVTCAAYTPQQSAVYFSSTPLSPVPSPRRHSDATRFRSPVRPTPSPRPRPQSSPYSLEVSRRRLSNSSVTSMPSFAPSPYMGRKSANSSAYTSPQIRGCQFFPTALAPPQPNPLQPGNVYLNSMFPSHDQYNTRFIVPETVASQRVPRTLRSDVDPDQAYFEDFAGLSEPPDLLGPLKETPLSPPPEDMMPADPTMVPHEQDLRFENDLYTPKWVRGHGNKREGWCGICKPGRWLVLKNSAFWYDKSFTHGVSAVTGQAFAAPKDIRRTEGSANIWEGLCGNCDQWVGLVTSKKKGTTWFRHAYKCHNHYKPDDALKRQRESEERRTVSTADAYSQSPLSIPASKPVPLALGYPGAPTRSGNPVNNPRGVSTVQSMLSMI
ncbi:hypothetical protein LOZ57_002304 [Ophidiomyces ophidiicola]|uniref:uncharacterized protein n=1 Tax=Ophidiomyces ophidiicola TaxID=1387563 RepID=UPI0020C522FA|nr:uncharacterized protein LOZ57_002304 [Ophidiomyces ophidiicola]KAI1949826.1 hypothetical protein LOZ57_002304 [Ophidiomyces ophidiicola]KAI2044682.1 hypothetical protein LOZ43_006286 [Ophidiomyces ophidiicola]KAI2081699.1 hypothetical protein LOZ36_006146 [Ophidiomyces ophidiicola]